MRKKSRSATALENVGEPAPATRSAADSWLGSKAPQLAALSWCIAEIRQSLTDAQAALEALRGAGGQGAAADTASADPDRLAAARIALHQAYGALAVVELPGATVLAQEAENLVDALERGVVETTVDVVARLGNALSALAEYLDDLLCGVADQPLYLYPAYRGLLEARGAERIHPADLFFPPIATRVVREGPTAAPLADGALLAVRSSFESGLLKLLRDPANREAIGQLHQAIATFEASDIARRHGSFWAVVLAYFEALRDGTLALDVLGKRLIARVNLQLRRTITQQAPVAERLQRDALFALARARGGSELVVQVRQAFALDDAVPEDFEIPRYGAVDRAARAQARLALSHATGAWDRAARGQTRELAVFAAAIDEYSQAVRNFGIGGLEALAQGWMAAARALEAAVGPVDEALGVEVAMTLLFAEEALESGLRERESTNERSTEMAARLASLLAGNAASPMPGWLQELAVAAQERVTMTAFISEVLANLRGVEKVLDAFFRDNGNRLGLQAALGELAQVGGALRLLDRTEAAAAVDSIKARVADLEQETASPDPSACEALALDVGALGFFIEDLRNPGREAATYRFDAESGRFFASLVDERRDALPGESLWAGWLGAAEPAAASAGDGALVRATDSAPAARRVADAHAGDDESESVAETVEQRLGALRRELAEALARLDAEPGDPAALAEVVTRLHQARDGAQIADDATWRARFDDALALLEKEPTVPADRLARVMGIEIAVVKQVTVPVSRVPLSATPETETPFSADAIGAALDTELLYVFLAEAHEVLDAIEHDAAALSESMSNQDLLTTIRRAFHTLKGSSRMVGLDLYGEAAWAVEQVMNLWLAEARDGSGELLRLVARARTVLRSWLAGIEQGAAWGAEAPELIAAAAALRDAGRLPAGFAAGTQVSLAGPSTADAANETDEVAVGGVEVIDDWAAEATTAPTEAVEPIDMPSAEFEAIDIHEPVSEIDQQRSLLELGGAEFLELDARSLSVPPIPDLQMGIETKWTQASPARREVLIGGRRIREALYAIFLSESDVSLATLVADADEWHRSPLRPANEHAQHSAHTLKGSAGVVGLDDVREVAEHIENFLAAQRALGNQTTLEDRADYSGLVERLQAMLHQFAAGMMPAGEPETILLARTLAARWPLADTEQTDIAVAPPVEAPVCVDEFDADLLPVFVEEAQDWLPQVGERLRDWMARPNDRGLPQWLMRALHTVKGGARMAGAMTLGQRIHEMEAEVEAAGALDEVPESLVEELISRHDEVMSMFEAVRARSMADPDADALAGAPSEGTATPQSVGEESAADALPADADALADEISVAGATQDPARLETGADTIGVAPSVPHHEPVAASQPETAQRPGAGQTQQPLVRVRADVLDDLVNQAGEVSIARSRIDNSMGSLRQSLGELAENVARLRAQLREVEIQAETQIQARLAQQRENQGDFDPLEFDRFTRLQELTRMLAESVNDVATVQRGAFRSLDEASQDLLRQGRVLRELQHDLMQVRMVPFGSASDRMYRVVRQTAKQLGKRVTLDIRGGAVELDRGVLERMAAPIEHLLRNCVAHGIEAPGARSAAGKPETGEITVEVRQDGNEVVLLFADDGAGLDYEKIRARALSAGLVRDEQQLTEATIAGLILMPGFSTESEVSEISGRGVGLDVVHEEVSALGGRIAIESGPGTGTRFTIHLPLTMAIAQVVIVTVGELKYAVPSTSFEQVLQLRPQALAQGYEQGAIEWQGAQVPLYYLATLVDAPGLTPVAQHYSQVVVLHSAGQRIAVHVDTVSRNQEVVVKNVGRQVARVRGVAGATVMGNGEIVLILNPGLLAQQVAKNALSGARMAEVAPALAVAPPTVMVVDDSLTVRRATQRLLNREGFEVLLAKDGLDALHQLKDQLPDVILVDIEMPRMDGFDLTRALRGDPRTGELPIVMITSRTAEKHRSRALELGVDVFLGKPYRDEELVDNIRRLMRDAEVRQAVS